MPESDRDIANHCAQEVQQFDHDRYLCAAMAPAHKRASLFALYAFNAEVARIAESVSEVALGQIKLQWWRDQIDAAYNAGPRPPGVAGALYDVIAQGALSHDLFTRLLDAREQDLGAEPPETLAALESYAEATSATLVELALQCLSPKVAQRRADQTDISTLAREAGIAWALNGIIRAVPHHAAQGRCMLPRDLLADAGIDWTQLMTQRGSAALAGVISQLRTSAERHMHAARTACIDMDKIQISALLPMTLARHDLRQIAKADNDPFAPRAQNTRGILRTIRFSMAVFLGRP